MENSAIRWQGSLPRPPLDSMISIKPALSSRKLQVLPEACKPIRHERLTKSLMSYLSISPNIGQTESRAGPALRLHVQELVTRMILPMSPSLEAYADERIGDACEVLVLPSSMSTALSKRRARYSAASVCLFLRRVCRPVNAFLSS